MRVKETGTDPNLDFLQSVLEEVENANLAYLFLQSVLVEVEKANLDYLFLQSVLVEVENANLAKQYHVIKYSVIIRNKRKGMSVTEAAVN